MNPLAVVLNPVSWARSNRPLPLLSILKRIRDEIAYLQGAARGLSKADFLTDETLKRAFVRSLEIMGEAVKQIPEEQRAEYEEIPWRAISGMRDMSIYSW
jgi:uncharacterized protein with HEPN domain